MTAINKGLYSSITDEELRTQLNNLIAKTESLRIKILKDCNEIEGYITQSIVLEEELKTRNKI
jgi:hypothetical protein